MQRKLWCHCLPSHPIPIPSHAVRLQLLFNHQLLITFSPHLKGSASAGGEELSFLCSARRDSCDGYLCLEDGEVKSAEVTQPFLSLSFPSFPWPPSLCSVCMTDCLPEWKRHTRIRCLLFALLFDQRARSRWSVAVVLPMIAPVLHSNTCSRKE